MTDAWAAAQAQQNNGGQAAETSSQVMPEQTAPGQQSQLFGGPAGSPSLFNKTHLLGSKRRGVVTKEPYDRQKIDFNTKQPLFWPRIDHPAAEKRKPVSIADGGDPQQPVMDTFIEMDTEYGDQTPAEAAATGRSEPYEGSERTLVVGGADLKALKKALSEAAPGVVKPGLVGNTIEGRRVGQKPNPGGNPSWITEFTIS